MAFAWSVHAMSVAEFETSLKKSADALSFYDAAAKHLYGIPKEHRLYLTPSAIRDHVAFAKKNIATSNPTAFDVHGTKKLEDLLWFSDSKSNEPKTWGSQSSTMDLFCFDLNQGTFVYRGSQGRQALELYLKGEIKSFPNTSPLAVWEAWIDNPWLKVDGKNDPSHLKSKFSTSDQQELWKHYSNSHFASDTVDPLAKWFTGKTVEALELPPKKRKPLPQGVNKSIVGLKKPIWIYVPFTVGAASLLRNGYFAMPTSRAMWGYGLYVFSTLEEFKKTYGDNQGLIIPTRWNPTFQPLGIGLAEAKAHEELKKNPKPSDKLYLKKLFALWNFDVSLGQQSIVLNPSALPLPPSPKTLSALLFERFQKLSPNAAEKMELLEEIYSLNMNSWNVEQPMPPITPTDLSLIVGNLFKRGSTPSKLFAIQILRNRNEPEMMAHLVTALQDADSQVRNFSFDVLSSKPADVVQGFAKSMITQQTPEDIALRTQKEWIEGGFFDSKSPRYFELASALSTYGVAQKENKTFIDLRLRALGSVHTSQDSKAVQTYMKALEDPSDAVKGRAYSLLSELEIETLKPQLSFLFESNIDVRLKRRLAQQILIEERLSPEDPDYARLAKSLAKSKDLKTFGKKALAKVEPKADDPVSGEALVANQEGESLIPTYEQTVQQQEQLAAAVSNSEISPEIRAPAADSNSSQADSIPNTAPYKAPTNYAIMPPPNTNFAPPSYSPPSNTSPISNERIASPGSRRGRIGTLPSDYPPDSLECSDMFRLLRTPGNQDFLGVEGEIE